MIDKVQVKRDQLAMFHAYELSDSEIDYLIRHFPIEHLNMLIELTNIVSSIYGSCSDSEVLASLVAKVHIFDR